MKQMAFKEKFHRCAGTLWLQISGMA